MEARLKLMLKEMEDRQKLDMTSLYGGGLGSQGSEKRRKAISLLVLGVLLFHSTFIGDMPFEFSASMMT